MGLTYEQIEHAFGGDKSGRRKWLKNQRNRKIRRVKQTDVPNIKYKGWEW
jgi:hypothetical protein